MGRQFRAPGRCCQKQINFKTRSRQNKYEIIVDMTEISICSTDEFSKTFGLCADAGAPRSVVRYKKLDCITNKWGNLKITMSQNSSKF